MRLTLVFVIPLFLLCACGGGGDGGGANPSNPPTQNPTNQSKWTPQVPSYNGLRTPIINQPNTAGQGVMRSLTGVDLFGSLMLGELYEPMSILPAPTAFNLGDADEITCSSGSATETQGLSEQRLEITFTDCKSADLTLNGRINGFISTTNQFVLNTNLDMTTPNGIYNLRGHIIYIDDSSFEGNLTVTDNTISPAVTYWFEDFFVTEFGGFRGRLYSSDFGFFYIDVANVNNINNEPVFDLITFDQTISIAGIAQQQAVLRVFDDLMPIDLSSPYEFSTINRTPFVVVNTEQSIQRDQPLIVDLDGTMDPDVQALTFDFNVTQGDETAIEVDMSGDEVFIRFLEKGDYAIEVSATDPEGASSSSSFSVDVQAADASPVFSNIPITGTNNIAGEIFIENEALDGPFNVSLESAPLGVTFNPDTLMYEWVTSLASLGAEQRANISFNFSSGDTSSTATTYIDTVPTKLFSPKILELIPSQNAHYVNIDERLFLIDQGILTEVSVQDGFFTYTPFDFEFSQFMALSPGQLTHITDVDNDGAEELWFLDTGDGQVVNDRLVIIDTSDQSVKRTFGNRFSPQGQFINADLNNDGFEDVVIYEQSFTHILFGPSLGSADDIVHTETFFARNMVCDINDDGINEMGSWFSVVDPVTNTRIVEFTDGGALYYQVPNSDDACNIIRVDVGESSFGAVSFTLLNLKTGAETIIAQSSDFDYPTDTGSDFSYWTQNIDDDPEKELLMSYFADQENGSAYVVAAVDDFAAEDPTIITIDHPRINIGQFTPGIEQTLEIKDANGELINIFLNNTANETFVNYALEALSIQKSDLSLNIEQIARSGEPSDLTFMQWQDERLIAYSYDRDEVIEYAGDTITRTPLSGAVSALWEQGEPVYYQLRLGGRVIATKYDHNFTVLWEREIDIAGASSEQFVQINDDVVLITRDPSAILLMHAHTGEVLHDLNYETYARYLSGEPAIFEHNDTHYLMTSANSQKQWVAISASNEVTAFIDPRLNDEFSGLDFFRPMQLDNDAALEQAIIITDLDDNNFSVFVDESQIQSDGELIITQPWNFERVQGGSQQTCILLVDECAQYGVADVFDKTLAIRDRDTQKLLWEADFPNFGNTRFLFRQDPNTPGKYQLLLRLDTTLIVVE